MYCRKRRGEVGSQDCLMILVVLLAGLFIASYGAKHFGWLGFLLGVPVGLAVAFGVLYGVLLLNFVLVMAGTAVAAAVAVAAHRGKMRRGMIESLCGTEAASTTGAYSSVAPATHRTIPISTTGLPMGFGVTRAGNLV